MSEDLGWELGVSRTTWTLLGPFKQPFQGSPALWGPVVWKHQSPPVTGGEDQRAQSFHPLGHCSESFAWINVRKPYSKPT